MMADNGKQTTPLGINYREGFYSKQAIEKEIFPLLIQKSDASYFIPSLCGKVIRRQLFLDNVLANENVTIGKMVRVSYHVYFTQIQCIYLKNVFTFTDTTASLQQRVKSV